MFPTSQKRVAETFIKPVENEDFLSQNAERLQNIQKALRL